MPIADRAFDLKVGVVAAVRFTGYCDESFDDNLFCMAGVIGPAHHWGPFEDAWATVLRDEGLTEFKASDCVNRRGEFKDWTNPQDRSRVQERLVNIILGSPYLPFPMGIWVGIDKDAFTETLAPTIRKTAERSYDEPYLLAFTHLTARMVETQRTANAMVGASDRLGLIFDKQDEFAGRVLEMVKTIETTAEFPFRGIAFDDSRRHAGLQAADMLAYEARRYLVDTHASPPRPPRWGWKQLHARQLSDGQPRVYGDYWDTDTSALVSAQLSGEEGVS